MTTKQSMSFGKVQKSGEKKKRRYQHLFPIIGIPEFPGGRYDIRYKHLGYQVNTTGFGEEVKLILPGLEKRCGVLYWSILNFTLMDYGG